MEQKVRRSDRLMRPVPMRSSGQEEEDEEEKGKNRGDDREGKRGGAATL